MTGIRSYVMTVGVQYHGTNHPLGLTSTGYTVIEAPDYGTAHSIATAITGGQYAFIYASDDYPEEKLHRLHPAGEELRIAWLDRRGLRTLNALFEEAS